MNEYLNWTPEQIEELINSVYDGQVTRKNLPRNLYDAILSVMENSVLEGFGSGFAVDSSEADLLLGFRENMSVFSAAKTFQQVNDMSNFLITPEGLKTSFSQFKKHADEIFDIYNVNWLKTEHNTAYAKAQSARAFTQARKDAKALPLLRYQTVGDGRVRNEHRAFDGIVKPVNDKFWNDHYNPLDWNCRCIITQHEADEYEVTPDETIALRELPEVPKLFKGNPAKTGYIFDEVGANAHPYFKVADKYKEFKKDGFGLTGDVV